MITIDGLYKQYGSHEVLKGISLQVAAGEVYGFIGHNGAGKSTTMSILTGLLDFQSGLCMVNHKKVRKGQVDLYKEVGYLPEEPKFYLYMTALEYLDFLGTLGGMRTQMRKKRAADLLELVHLKESAKRPIGNYSRGMKQRLGLAAALFHDPKTLILDEPSSALDPLGRKDVVTIIDGLRKQGKTIFLSTHILGDVEQVCDRVGILHGGKIVMEGNLETLLDVSDQPIYDVEWAVKPDEEALALLNKTDCIQSFSLEGEVLTLIMNASKHEGESLLLALAPLGAGIRRIQKRRGTLEDLYMKVVNQTV